MDGAVRVLGEVRGTSAEDPLGPGDPLGLARWVRRALAAAGRRALDVDVLVLATDAEPDPTRLARFTRRALGPHGDGVPSAGLAGAGWSHEARLEQAETRAGRSLRGGVAIVAALGPGETATVRCVAAAG